MKNQVLYVLALCLAFCTQGLYAQNIDPDFARRIRPEYKVDFNAQKVELPTAHSKTVEELKAENSYCIAQKQKVETIIAEMDAANTPKNDPQYVKYQLTLKLLTTRASETGDKLSSLER